MKGVFSSICLFLIATAVTSCVDLTDDVSTIIIKQSDNFSQTKKALLLEDNGSATVGKSLRVSVVNHSYKFSGKESGNTFTVDGNHGATALDSSSINFNWSANDTLIINYDRKLRTFTKNSNVDGIIIVYNTF